MTFKVTWNGKNIEDCMEEYMEHFQDIFSNKIMPYLLANADRERKALRKLAVDANGKEYLADFDGNYVGPVPEEWRR